MWRCSRFDGRASDPPPSDPPMTTTIVWGNLAASSPRPSRPNQIVIIGGEVGDGMKAGAAIVRWVQMQIVKWIPTVPTIKCRESSAKCPLNKISKHRGDSHHCYCQYQIHCHMSMHGNEGQLKRFFWFKCEIFYRRDNTLLGRIWSLWPDYWDNHG